jgi:hypothetical protein
LLRVLLRHHWGRVRSLVVVTFVLVVTRVAVGVCVLGVEIVLIGVLNVQVEPLAAHLRRQRFDHASGHVAAAPQDFRFVLRVDT